MSTPLTSPLEAALGALQSYELGSSRGDLLPIDEAVRASLDYPDERQALEKRLLDTLEEASSLGQAYLLRQLALIGSAAAVAQIAPRLSHPDLADPACRTLASLVCPEAATALRERLPQLSGEARIGAILALGHRRDAASVSALTAYLGSEDAALAGATAHTLGRIGSPEAGRALAETFANSPGTRRSHLSHAIRECADRLAQAGETAAANTLRQLLG
jgi:HEAT repeat protein